MIDILILRTKKNTFTFYFFNDKIFETNISYNYHKNYYINNRDLFKKSTHILKKNNGKYLVKFN